MLDFTTLLSTSTFGQDYVDPENDEDDAEGPVFSTVTGTYRHPKRYFANGVAGMSYVSPRYDSCADECFTDANDLESQASALSIRNTSSAVARVLGSAAGMYYSIHPPQCTDFDLPSGEFLSNRTYKGLEPRYGMDAPAVVQDGRSGIARGYGDERE